MFSRQIFVTYSLIYLKALIQSKTVDRDIGPYSKPEVSLTGQGKHLKGATQFLSQSHGFFPKQAREFDANVTPNDLYWKNKR